MNWIRLSLDHSLWSGCSETESHTHLLSKMLRKMKIKVKVNYTGFLRTTLQRMQDSGVTYTSSPSVKPVCNIPEAAEHIILGYSAVPCAMERKYKINCKYRTIKCYVLQFQRVSCIGIYVFTRFSSCYYPEHRNGKQSNYLWNHLDLHKKLQQVTSVAISPLFHVLLRSGSYSFKNMCDSHFADFANTAPLIQEFLLI